MDHESQSTIPARWLSLTFLILGIILVILLVWYATQVFLLAFAGILVAIFFHALTRWLSYYTPLAYSWAFTVVVLVLVALLAGMLWFAGGRLMTQVNQLSEQLPQSVQQLEKEIRQYQWGEWLLSRTAEPQQVLARTGLYSRITGWVTSVIGMIIAVVVIIFVGLYIAGEPGLYAHGALLLVPPRYHQEAREAFNRVIHALQWWILGQLLTMIIVGVTTGLGLWFLGVPLAFSLGFLAFVLEIIPNFGPILAAIPALLLAWTQGTTTFVYVLLLYVFVQGLESYVVLPLVQRRAVRLPPALTILSVVLLGLLAGVLGALIAAPLIVTVMVLVKTLYVRDTLHEQVSGEL